MAARVLAQCREQPFRTLGGIATGWGVLLTLVSLGDLVVENAAYALFDWTRQQSGYGEGRWGPYYLCSAVLSCSAFALSGYAVPRPSGPCQRAAVVGFALSVTLAVGTSVVAAVLIQAPTPTPHFWFYVIWLALPFASYVGLLLIPALILAGGWCGRRHASYQSR